MPRYPVYVPSKARSHACQTVRFLIRDNVPFSIVVEPQDEPAYANQFGAERLLVLDRNDGGLIYVRNWIKAHSIELGFERHWQLDDNIRTLKTWYRGKRLPCDAGLALSVCEDFTDRYENIAVSGLNYDTFARSGTSQPREPFWLNVHVYSCTLVNNAIPYAWRSVYNDDTDLCLQALAGGWCTVLLNAFMAEKLHTMKISGGNTDALYQGDGRLRMARALERLWPGVVTTQRRFKRPQHVVKNQWRSFDTPLRLKPGVEIKQSNVELALRQTATSVHSERLRRMLATDHGASPT